MVLGRLLATILMQALPPATTWPPLRERLSAGKPD